MIRSGPDERYELDEPVAVTMRRLGGGSIELAAARIDVGGSVILFGTMTAAELYDAMAWGDFHLDDEEQPGQWDDSQPVNVTLRLRAPVAASYPSGDELVVALFGDSPTPLRETEAWYALEATQVVTVPDMDDATAEWGLQTRWADDG